MPKKKEKKTESNIKNQIKTVLGENEKVVGRESEKIRIKNLKK